MYRDFEKSRRRQRDKLVRRCTSALIAFGVLFVIVAVYACISLQNSTLI